MGGKEKTQKTQDWDGGERKRINHQVYSHGNIKQWDKIFKNLMGRKYTLEFYTLSQMICEGPKSSSMIIMDNVY